MKALGFKIHKPKLHHSGFPGFQAEIMKIAIKAQLKADEKGRASPQLIIFSEVALKYSFNIAEGDVVRSIEQIQKCLPKDLWIGVAFSVFQLNGLEIPRNTGYIFDSQNLHLTPKRICTNFDEAMLENSFGRDYRVYGSKWNEDGSDLQQYGVKFPFLAAPNGKEVEIRVCFDITADPIVPSPGRISAVPAHKLSLQDSIKLSSRRDLIIINDHAPFGDAKGKAPSNVI